MIPFWKELLTRLIPYVLCNMSAILVVQGKNLVLIVIAYCFGIRPVSAYVFLIVFFFHTIGIGNIPTTQTSLPVYVL